MNRQRAGDQRHHKRDATRIDQSLSSKAAKSAEGA
jgi:hypothetical protein